MQRFVSLIVIYVLAFLILFRIQVADALPFISSFLDSDCIITTKKIYVKGYPQAWNPSLIRAKQGLLLTFRITPDSDNKNISYIGIVMLNEEFEPISEPWILNSRHFGAAPSQSEDARIFRSQDKIYIICNDNPHVTSPSRKHHRDMYVAELTYSNGKFTLGPAKMLFHKEHRKTIKWQKNWVPFEWGDSFLIGYSMIPHMILSPDSITGECTPKYCAPKVGNWKWGMPRGGTPAILVDGEYLAFFHSSLFMKSVVSPNAPMWHYFMGAYTFSPNPPFQITSISPYPLIARDFIQIAARRRKLFSLGVLWIAVPT